MAILRAVLVHSEGGGGEAAACEFDAESRLTGGWRRGGLRHPDRQPPASAGFVTGAWRPWPWLGFAVARRRSLVATGRCGYGGRRRRGLSASRLEKWEASVQTGIRRLQWEMATCRCHLQECAMQRAASSAARLKAGGGRKGRGPCGEAAQIENECTVARQPEGSW